MKRLLLILIIPTLSYSQTYDEIVNMTSEKKFKITMIGGGYEKLNNLSTDSMIVYGLNYMNILDIETVDKMGIYTKYKNMNMVMITDTEKTDYNTITEKIKKNCEFDDVLQWGEHDYLTYKCPGSDGKIGFSVTDNGGTILHSNLPNKKEE
tara:strand:+ start:2072 stop:2524 length:453 start_codon:yes stop_codon:yes gene_type:complete